MAELVQEVWRRPRNDVTFPSTAVRIQIRIRFCSSHSRRELGLSALQTVRGRAPSTRKRGVLIP